MNQTSKARVKQSTTAACRFDTAFRMLEGRLLLGDQCGVGLGAIQNVEDDKELPDEDPDEELPEGKENLDVDK